MGAEIPQSLYAPSVRITPRRAVGRYANLRIAAMVALLGLYYAAPWILVNGHPLVLLDLPHRRFHVFGMTLLPQDLYLLTGLLLIAAVGLFFFTNLAGRLWCGYACPQTVWTESFLWIEHWLEGDRHQRLKLQKAPWGVEKALRRGGKHTLWAAFALWTGLTFVAYFVPARELFPAAAHLQLAGWPLFWSLFYGFATWGNAGFMREQVCKYMCPYARFQSAMFDRDTLIIAYDEQRGEPRKGAVRKLAGLAPHPTVGAAGDCVDCSICAQVCPVGIDIRDGLQYECIACAACVDACNVVMDSVGKPRGLIRYTSERRDQTGRFHLLRPRAIGYGIVFAAACIGFLAVLFNHAPMEFDVIRDRHSLYRELPDGHVENLYTLKVVNKDNRPHQVDFAARLENGEALDLEPDDIALGAGESRAVLVSARVRSDKVSGIASAMFRLEVEDAPDLHITRKAAFLAGEHP